MSAKRWSAREALTLGGFALLAGLVLVLVNAVTRTPVEQVQQQRLEATLSEVLPTSYFDNDLTSATLSMPEGERDLHRTVYRAYLNGQPSAVIINTEAPDGYSGAIELLVGITTSGEVTGVRVLQHSETPGLGDDIEIKKSAWILSFDGKQLQGEVNWRVKRDGGDFDQFTGATITPRAIVREVHQTLSWFSLHRDTIFSTP